MSILECKALTKRYGGKSALEGVELSIEPGRIVGLLGPNGSGKTTLIKLANGLLTPTSGEIRIDGKAPSPETKAIVSYLPDRNALPDWMTVAQTVDYYADFYADFRRDAAQEMLARLGLDVSQRVKTLSKGTREKLQLILVMSRAAKLYLLDEPEAALSPMRQMAMLVQIDELKKRQSQFIIATHSPILMACPDAQVLLFSEEGIREVSYRETEHYQLSRRFLEDPERMLDILLNRKSPV